MLLDVEGSGDKLEKAVEYIRSQGIEVEDVTATDE